MVQDKLIIENEHIAKSPKILGDYIYATFLLKNTQI